MSDIMNRGDVLNTVAAECDMPPAKVDAVLKAFEGAIGRTLSQAGEVRIAGFGTFKTSARAARVSRNPRTGEPVAVAARTAARFIPGKGLKIAAASAAEGTSKTGSAAKAAPARADTKVAAGEAPAKAPKAKASAPKAVSPKAASPKAGAKADEGKAAPKAEKAAKAPAKKKK